MGVKLNIVSDLHDPKDIDFSKFNYDADYIVIAGDSEECLTKIQDEKTRRKSKLNMIFTYGNHDLFTSYKLIRKNYEGYPTQFQSVEFGGGKETFKYIGTYKIKYEEHNIVFITAPLLSLVPTDTKLCKKLGDYEFFKTLFPYESDNTTILRFNNLWNTKFIDDLTCIEAFVRETIEKEKNSKIILVTHGIPSFKLIENSIVYGSQLNIYWASDKCLFNNIFPHCSLWIHGHSHEFCDMMIDNTRCIRNPLRDYNMQIIPEAYSYTIEV